MSRRYQLISLNLATFGGILQTAYRHGNSDTVMWVGVSMALTELEVRKAKASEKPKKLADGGGMYLLVQTSGTKCWRMDYRFEGKRKTLALGVYPEVNMADARDRREEARKLLANGVDPGAIKKEAKQQRKKASQETVNGFGTIAREFLAMRAPMWTPGHARQWLGNMEKLAFPVIENRPIAEIEPMELLGIMRTVEAGGKFETRDRLLQAISAVFKYAKSTGRTKHNPAEIRMALAERPKVEHFPCIATDELPVFLRAITTYRTDTPQCVNKVIDIYNGYKPFIDAQM